jgi:glutamate racemase
VFTTDPRPIGVFDSGVGGLTVARSLMDLLPDEHLVYVGDTLRVPYGPRPLHEVRAFTAEIVADLAARDVKLVVVACNTATAAALETDPLTFPVPVLGVIDPAVTAAVRATRNGRVGVIGTAATIGSGAYERALAAADPSVEAHVQACPRFVELVEAGRTTEDEVFDVARAYLAPLVAADVDTLILGCTHYPLLTGVLSYLLGPRVVLVSSAEETARATFALLVRQGELAHGTGGSGHQFLSTGDPAAFAAMASRFLGPRVAAPDVRHLPVRSAA